MYLKSKEQLKHGLKVTFITNGIKQEGAISYNDNTGSFYLCHNDPSFKGFDVNNKLGFAYSYWLGNTTVNETLKELQINTIEEKTKPKSEIRRITIKHLRC